MVEAVTKVEKEWVISVWAVFKRAYCFKSSCVVQTVVFVLVSSYQ